MSKYTTYGKLDSLKFVVKNVSPSEKAIKVFGLKIPFNTSRDLLAIDEITEADIKASLAKGELANKIRKGSLKIVETTLNLIEVDPGQRAFVESAGLVPGSVEGVDPETVIVGGGGGGTVIEDGGTLSGEYDTDVLCKGNATMVGNVTVNGDLTVLGTLYNEGGYELTVKKAMYANSINFDKAIQSSPQGNFQVDGSLYFKDMYFPQCGGMAASLRVGGDLVGTFGYSGSPLFGYGYNDTSGLNVLVYGDMTVSTLNLNGGDSLTSNAGNGGNVTVYGNMQVYLELYMNGGSAYDTGFDAGGGGSLEVYGNFTISNSSWEVNFEGGSASGGNGGNGGYLEIHGNAILTNGDGDFRGYGGDCSSDNENHRAGSGCNIDIYGNLVCDSDLELGAGDRYGTLSAPGGTYPAYGGNIFVLGDARVDEIDNRGGSIYTSGFAPSSSGGGGSIDIRGNLTVNEEIISHGGYSDVGETGSGGYISVYGNLSCSQYIALYSQSSSNGNAGSGGSLYVRGNAVVDDSIEVFGGDSSGGNGGSGGYIQIDGSLICNYIDASGGNCDSVIENYIAGSGGYIEASGLNASNSTISFDAGERYGATTVANPFNYTPNAGAIYVYGDLICGSLYGNGCHVNTNYPNGVGGQGGYVEVLGNMIADYVELDGGNSVGNTAGNGGSLLINGSCKFNSGVYSRGGNAYNSVGIGSDAGNNGAGPNSMIFRGGIKSQNLDVRDGQGDVGSGASPYTVSLFLSGNCTLQYLAMTNRAGVKCSPIDDNQVILKIGTMTDKVTLNNSVGTESVNISSDVANSLYISDGSGWYSLTGTTIFV